MRSILFLIAGVAIGFVVAHQVSKTPEGKAFFDDIDRKAHEFGDARGGRLQGTRGGAARGDRRRRGRYPRPLSR